MFVMCLQNLNLYMCFVGILFCGFTFYQKISVPNFDVFNTAFQAGILCAADVTVMLRSHGGLVSVAGVMKLKYTNV